MIRNQKGVALLYVLIALVFVGAIGSLTLNMANKEKSDSGLRASSESARFAATAGLTYVANFFTNEANQADILLLLNAWRSATTATPPTTPTQRWITGQGTGLTRFNDASYITRNDMRFRVQITNIQFTLPGGMLDENDILLPGRQLSESPITIKFKSESIDNSGGRAENIGTYRIFGYASNQINSEVPENALFFGNAGMMIHAPIEINGGAAYIGGNTVFQPIQEHAAGSVFRGNVFVESNTPEAGITTFDGVTFHRPVFIGLWPGNTTAVWGGRNTLRFLQGFGAEMPYVYNQSVNFQVNSGNVYLFDKFRATGGISFNGTGQTLFHRLEGIAGTTTQPFYNHNDAHATTIAAIKTSTAGTITRDAAMTRESILAAFNMVPDKRPVTIHTTRFGAAAASWNTNRTSNDLNALWDVPANRRRFNGGPEFIYVTATNTMTISQGTEAFRGRAIIELRGNQAVTVNFNCTDAGNVLVYAPSSSTANHVLRSPTAPAAPATPQGVATPIGASFRGFVVNDGSNGFYVNGASIRGSLYSINSLNLSTNWLWIAGQPARTRIDFDRQVLQEWVDAGIVSFGANPGGGAVVGGASQVRRVARTPPPNRTFHEVTTQLMGRGF